jgi:hypothetical protein
VAREMSTALAQANRRAGFGRQVLVDDRIVENESNVAHSDYEAADFDACVQSMLLGQTSNEAGPRGAGGVTYRFLPKCIACRRSACPRIGYCLIRVRPRVATHRKTRYGGPPS